MSNKVSDNLSQLQVSHTVLHNQKKLFKDENKLLKDDNELLKDDNKLLKQENKLLKEEILLLAQQMKSLYHQNLRIKQQQQTNNLPAHKQNCDTAFIEQCQCEIDRLKKLLSELTVQSMFPMEATAREQIKDRIIMKLQDEVISTKLQLKQMQEEIRQWKQLQNKEHFVLHENSCRPSVARGGMIRPGSGY